MTASNHFVTGALIATSVSSPVFAVVLAFLSHFALDVLPHYGEINPINKRRFMKVLKIDSAVLLVLLTSVALLKPESWVVLIIAGLVAVSPDVLWLRPFIVEQKGGQATLGPLSSLLKQIQWGERPDRLWIEIVWFISFVTILSIVLVK